MHAVEIDSLDGLMARYAFGALPEPARILVAAHLALKPDNRRFVNAMESVAGQSLEQETPVALSSRDRQLADIFSAPPLIEPVRDLPRDAILPPVLRSFIGHDMADIPWKTKMPGYREYSLGEIDGCEASMLWIKQGRKMPSHTHDGSELTLVLDGAFRDMYGRYGRGDISVANEDVDHRPIAEDERPCICFAVTDAPLRMTGSYRQLFSDFLGR